MMLEWIHNLHGRELMEDIVDILVFEQSRDRRTRPALHEKMAQPLRDVLNLMSANIEEPLSTDQLSECVGRSKRQLERLFTEPLGTSPVRHYLELRITESRRLLQHSDLSLVEVALACGFLSPSHFSKCHTSFFGHSPSKEMRFGCVRSAKSRRRPTSQSACPQCLVDGVPRAGRLVNWPDVQRTRVRNRT